MYINLKSVSQLFAVLVGLTPLYSNAGYYVSGDFGVANFKSQNTNMQLNSSTNNTIKLKDSQNHQAFGLGLGKRFKLGSSFFDEFTVGLQYDYFRDNKIHGRVFEFGDPNQGNFESEIDLKTQMLLLDSKLRFKEFYHLKPFLGFGIGYAKHSTSTYTDRAIDGGLGSGITLKGATNYDVAFQYGAGIAVNFTNNFSAELSHYLIDAGKAKVSDEWIGNSTIDAGPSFDVMYQISKLALVYKF